MKTTITISSDIKRVLDRERAGKTWEEFLMELLKKAKQAEKLLAVSELEKIFSAEDAEKIEKLMDRVRLKWAMKKK